MLDFHPRRPCCMRPLPLSRTVRARLPPPRPHPREIVPLRQGWRVSLHTLAIYRPPSKPHICFSTCAECQHYQQIFPLSIVRGQNRHGWKFYQAGCTASLTSCCTLQLAQTLVFTRHLQTEGRDSEITDRTKLNYNRIFWRWRLWR